MFCPQCGKEVTDEQAFCHHCGAALHPEAAGGDASAAPEVAAAGEDTSGRQRTPWEDREAKGFFRGLFQTANEALFRPSQFFRTMSVTGGLTDPLLFGLILGMVGFLFSAVWKIALHGSMQGLIPGMLSNSGPDMFQGVGLALFAFFSPFFIILGMFVSAGILHVCLMMVKGAKAGFEATFRVVAFASSAQIFAVIPACGSLIVGIWALVLYIVGLREAHETSGSKAGFAVFLPLIVCCGLLLFALALMLGAAAGSLGMILNQMQK